MNKIRTIGKGMGKLTRKQLLLLEIQALVIITHDRPLNKAEIAEIQETPVMALMDVPFELMLSCADFCFSKHSYN
jgi:hypothetical protein